MDYFWSLWGHFCHVRVTVSYFGPILGSLLACESHFKVLWVHFEGAMLAYEGHFRVLWAHFEVRPKRDPK